MNKIQQKDKIILNVKKAIKAKMRRSIDGGYVELDDNDIDHIAAEVAEFVYDFYKPIDKEPVGALGKRGRQTICAKEQQIEEMSKNLYGYSIDTLEDCKYVAEELYNAGYRKTFTSDLASDTQKAFKEGYSRGIAVNLESVNES